MQLWQKYWLIALIIFSVYHIIRDILQDRGVRNMLTLFTKPALTPFEKQLWTVCNTYVWAILEILLATWRLSVNSFGPIGYITIVLALLLLFVWIYYWFFL